MTTSPSVFPALGLPILLFLLGAGLWFHIDGRYPRNWAPSTCAALARYRRSSIWGSTSAGAAAVVLTGHIVRLEPGSPWAPPYLAFDDGTGKFAFLPTPRGMLGRLEYTVMAEGQSKEIQLHAWFRPSEARLEPWKIEGYSRGLVNRQPAVAAPISWALMGIGLAIFILVGYGLSNSPYY